MALPFTDNFNRANADPIGGNWTINPSATGSGRVNSNTLNASTTGAGVHGCYVNSETFPNDMYAQVISASKSANDGPTIRQSTSADSHYRVGYRSSTILRVFKRITGTDTQIGSDYTVSALSSTDIVKIRVVGTVLTLSINGVDQATTQTDSALSSGVAGCHWVTGSNSFDNYEAGSTSSASVVPMIVNLYRQNQ